MRRGFAKKGQASVGVARQYCGSLGKVDNCQGGVFVGYASRQGYALVDKRLFIPEQWFHDEYAARRAKCGLPEDVTFQSKPQLAAAMVRGLYAEGVLPFRAIVADCLYGNSPEFWTACEACVGTVAFVVDSRRHASVASPRGDPAPPLPLPRGATEQARNLQTGYTGVYSGRPRAGVQAGRMVSPHGGRRDQRTNHV